MDIYFPRGNLHANELEWALTDALPPPTSPYYRNLSSEWMVTAIEECFNGLATAAEALARAEQRYRDGIAESVRGHLRLRRQWEEDCRRQADIDTCRSEGRKIPAAWIRNPYYLAYYRAAGLLDDGP